MTNQIPTQFQNDDLSVTVHRKPSCQIELDVKVSEKIIKQARKEAIKAISREVALPGFRKGKAPEETILRKFSNDVEKQLHKTLADAAYVEAQKLVRIPLLNNNSRIGFDLKSKSETEAELVYTFETDPEVPSVDAKEFTPKPVERPETGDKQIDEAIRQMMFFYADWKPVSDRPIQDGDFILIDLDTIEEGVPQSVFRQIRFEVSKERMADWMKRLVEGAKSGDVLEGMSEADETATEEEKKEFNPKKVRLTILKAEEASLPELNDEFAKKVGAETVAQMRESITKMLNDRADQKVQDELREQVNDFLTQRYPFDLPASLPEAERKHRETQLLKDPKQKAQWDKMSPEEKEKIREKLFQEASQAVRLFFLSRKIVYQAQIPITHKEIEDEAISSMHAFGHRNVPVDHIPREVFALALSKVILLKAQDYLIQAQAPSAAPVSQ